MRLGSINDECTLWLSSLAFVQTMRKTFSLSLSLSLFLSISPFLIDETEGNCPDSLLLSFILYRTQNQPKKEEKVS